MNLDAESKTAPKQSFPGPLTSTRGPQKNRPWDRQPFERHVSFGGVVYRCQDHQPEVLLCGRISPKLWALPKGTPNPGESREETALREVSEETGLQVEIEAPLGSIQYWFQHDGKRIQKRVHFYLMRPSGGRLDDHDPEFDHVQWFPIDEALHIMTHVTEKTVMERAKALIAARNGPGAPQ